ncbi:MAG: hypothetical protein H7Y11_02180, partial [Armatimonadetes bacterium]|nr:hypothetical protein [Anaerolineae bacterium]
MAETSWIENWHYQARLPLLHRGDCHLLAVSGRGTDLVIYVEEMYGADGGGWAQHALTLDGRILHSAVDSDTADGQPLTLPLDSPRLPLPRFKALHMAGARYRGLRATDRVSELGGELSIADKMAFAGRLGLTSPMQILGIAESTLLAAEPLAPHAYLVCRRVRVLVALPAVLIAADGQPYDYETQVLHLAHRYDDRDLAP